MTGLEPLPSNFTFQPAAAWELGDWTQAGTLAHWATTRKRAAESRQRRALVISCPLLVRCGDASRTAVQITPARSRTVYGSTPGGKRTRSLLPLRRRSEVGQRASRFDPDRTS